MKDDLISRKEVIKAIEKLNIPEDMSVFEILGHIEVEISVLPSATEESFEWCTDCKEYDQETHCCHRWTKVIRQTVEELKAERKGHWIKIGMIENTHLVSRCSECGYQTIDAGNFCTDCGARMGGGA